MITDRCRYVAALTAAVFFAFVGSTHAQGTCSTHWDVFVSITSPHTSIGALQFQLNYANAPGDFYGSGVEVDCTSPLESLTPPMTLFAADDVDVSRYLTMALYSAAGFPAPTTIARCVFVATADPVSSDFDLNILDVSDPSLNLIDPPPTMDVALACSKCGDGTLDAGEVCDPGIAGQECCNLETCDFTPLTAGACLAAPTAKLVIGDNANDSKDYLGWMWKDGVSVSQAALGDPTVDETYVLCVYDSDLSEWTLRGSVRVEPSAMWRSRDPRGYTYNDRAAVEDGVRKITLRSADAGHTMARFQARGLNLPMPPPVSPSVYFNNVSGVTVQLRNSSGTCWSNTFESSSVTRNDGVAFRAKTP